MRWMTSPALRRPLRAVGTADGGFLLLAWHDMQERSNG